jgi:competence protein ComEC
MAKKTTSKKTPAKKAKKAPPKKSKKAPAKKSVATKKTTSVKEDPTPVTPPKKVLYEVYATKNEQAVYDKPGSKKAVTKLLLASYLSVTGSKEVDGEKWLEVYTYGKKGWVPERETTSDRHLKVFFIDVGQGDGALMEVGDKKFIFDGGPREDANVYRFLNWLYRPEISKKKKVKIDGIFISHFDEDHYGGIINVINDKNFEFDTIYVAGIGKFKAGTRGTTLGDLDGNLLTTYFNDLDDLKRKFKKDGQKLINDFISAVDNAEKQGRLKNGIKRLAVESPTEIKYVFPENHKINGLPFNIRVLGPIFRHHGGKKGFDWFKDASHTVNGHSLVLKVNYGERTMMFGGDLNTDAEEALLEFHKDSLSILDVDIAKSCHHGSSEFSVEFMAALNPYATVISSGDNESYAHPRADALGCAGKYTKSKRPLVFSTELARSVSMPTKAVPTPKIQYGMINLRCDGKQIFLAQKKEAKAPVDMWDSYGPL